MSLEYEDNNHSNDFLVYVSWLQPTPYLFCIIDPLCTKCFTQHILLDPDKIAVHYKCEDYTNDEWAN